MTDIQGHYEVDGLSLGDHVLRVYAADYPAVETSIALEDTSEQDFSLSRGGHTLTVHVYDSKTLLPISGVRALLSRDGIPIGYFVTNAEGEALMTELSVGSYEIEELTSMGLPRTTVELSTNETLEIQLPFQALSPMHAQLGPLVPSFPAAVSYSANAGSQTYGSLDSELQTESVCMLFSAVPNQCSRWRCPFPYSYYLWLGRRVLDFGVLTGKPVAHMHTERFVNDPGLNLIAHSSDWVARTVQSDSRWCLWESFFRYGTIYHGRAHWYSTEASSDQALTYNFSEELGRSIAEMYANGPRTPLYASTRVGYVEIFHFGDSEFDDLTLGYGGIDSVSLELRNISVDGPTPLKANRVVTGREPRLGEVVEYQSSSTGERHLRFRIDAEATYQLDDDYKFLTGYIEDLAALPCLQNCFGHAIDHTRTTFTNRLFSAHAYVPAFAIEEQVVGEGDIEYEKLIGYETTGSDGYQWYTEDSVVRLTAAPRAGYEFKEWRWHGSGFYETSAATTIVLTMTEDVQVTAIFERPEDEDEGNEFTSHTPEDKFGPLGYDPENVTAGSEQRFIKSTETLDYRIDFWNKPDAVVPTQDAVIIDWLDPAVFDISTLEITRVGFLNWDLEISSGQVVDTRIDCMPEMNIAVEITAGLGMEIPGFANNGDLDENTLVFWFHCIDPATGEWPEDPMAGFLPPFNPETGFEIGWIEYSVDSVAGLESGTELANVAYVEFDFAGDIYDHPAPKVDPDVEPADPAPWINTIDAAGPNSRIESLPNTSENEVLTIRWSGEDDEGGSGIARYDIYVSTDDEPFELWLESTSDMEALFEGIPGHTYAFYTRATDNVGHVEGVPPTPDAVTAVVSDLAIDAGPRPNGGGRRTGDVGGMPPSCTTATRVIWSLRSIGATGTAVPGRLCTARGGGRFPIATCMPTTTRTS